MIRLAIVTIQYYRSLLLYNITFTVLTIFLVGIGIGSNPAGFFFSKLTGFAAAVGLHYFSSVNTFFYYRNAGLPIRRLYIYALAIDVILFIVITSLIITFTHAASYIKG